MNFHSIYDQGFARVAAATIPVHPAQPHENAKEILSVAEECSQAGAALVVFPELSVSGYCIDDLLLQDVLLDNVIGAIRTIVDASRTLMPVIIVGAPIMHGNRLYNCAVSIHRGQILGITPKQHLANYREFYERRHFAVPTEATPAIIDTTTWGISPDPFSACVPFGPQIIDVEDVPGLHISPELCEDMWVPVTPSSLAALSGATVICNLSASPITVGRAQDRKLLVQSASARLGAAYLYTAAGRGESTTDLSWDGHTMIYECGDLLAEGERFAHSGRVITMSDIDLDRLRSERIRQGSFHDNAERLASQESSPAGVAEINHALVSLEPPRTDLGLRRQVERFPFVPTDPASLEQDCYEAYNIQVSGLVQRLRSIGNPKVVIGVSGGLDSTHALIVAARAMDLLGRPRTDILAYTMPGFATSDHTKNNAMALAQSLGVSFDEIDIRPAAEQMLADMGHPYAAGEGTYDVTFENVQAGLRTDYLFRLANHHAGIVLGTGDLSELALGWCTYGVGDQMSHYAVNTGVPKTMIQHLIRWVVASGQFSENTGKILTSILGTEISPELVPSRDGEKMQSTQDIIGPYALQDFTLFYMLRRGARPSKIAFLAEKAWSDASEGLWPAGFPESEKVEYSLGEIVKWETLFLRRFFSQQFKRSALPNGPKVMAGGSLSPRGDWRMPSDVSGADWVSQLESSVAGVQGSGIPASRASLPSTQVGDVQ
ncbi:NAD(+) synthase [Schaalia sp. ZJ1691]|uniref:NAD(+) synthase n=1 Tax=Schaalia sp. ZJ1691 TaxID=2709404 RepID=UPI0013ED8112|nr:NAD(+) synthase [Schaalia sp. ZJ1691]